MRIAFLFPVWLLSFAAFYLLLAGQTSVTELIATAPIALAAALCAAALHGQQRHRIAARAPWPRLVFRVMRALVADSWRIGGILCRAMIRRPHGEAGSLASQPFDGDGATPRDAGRRAIVVIANSIAPNGIVLDPRPAGGSLRIHRLAPARAAADTRWPV
jgi:hypothetical protein